MSSEWMELVVFAALTETEDRLHCGTELLFAIIKATGTIHIFKRLDAVGQYNLQVIQQVGQNKDLVEYVLDSKRQRC